MIRRWNLRRIDNVGESRLQKDALVQHFRFQGNPAELKMLMEMKCWSSIMRSTRGLVAPQNTFLESIARNFAGQSKCMKLFETEDADHFLFFLNRRLLLVSQCSHRRLSNCVLQWGIHQADGLCSIRSSSEKCHLQVHVWSFDFRRVKSRFTGGHKLKQEAKIWHDRVPEEQLVF